MFLAGMWLIFFTEAHPMLCLDFDENNDDNTPLGLTAISQGEKL